MSTNLKLTNQLAHLPNDVRITKYESHQTYFELFLSWPEDPETRCPCCESVNFIGKGRSSVKTVYHIPIGGAATYLTFSLQRYRCKDCGKYFTESPYWLHPYLKLSMDLYLSICASLQSVTSIKQISEDLHIPEKTVTATMNSVHFDHPISLPETLCIDEFKGDTGFWDQNKKRFITNKFHCNIADGDSGCVVDVLPRMDLQYLEKYIKQFSPAKRARVKYFCTDLHGGFLTFAKKYFPNVFICVDMFHVVQLLNDNLHQIRRKIQNDLQNKADDAKLKNDSGTCKYMTDQYNLLKSSSRLLLTAEANQTDSWKRHVERNKRKLDVIFGLYPELKEAYDALQDFHRIIRTPQYGAQRIMFSDFLDNYTASDYESIRHVAFTLRRNRNYIQNTWKQNKSNAVCEGLNNRIKVLKRNAYGQHSFPNFRQRILFACGYTQFVKDTYSIVSVRKTAEKSNKKGGKRNVRK